MRKDISDCSPIINSHEFEHILKNFLLDKRFAGKTFNLSLFASPILSDDFVNHKVVIL